ncbi:MAG: choice-of-anchor tandem repeat GloVer-containing protein, partial [Candidatus Korobacteraceae bacterium]
MTRPDEDAIRSCGTKPTAAAGLLVAMMLLLAAVGSQAQTYQVIHDFAGGLDGSEPTSGVTLDAAGNLYGTTFEGDALTGTVYRLVHKSSSWVLMPLYLFPYEGSGGSIPYARVIFGKDGSLYGTAAFGGNLQGCSGGCGAVFNMKPTPNPPITPLSPWIETPLYVFAGGTDGANPFGADIIFDQAGNLYGTTYNGGGGSCTGGCGTVYKLTPSSGSWTESILYTFTQNGDAQHPWGGVTFDTAGNLYGTTVYGGAYGKGAIYELTPAGAGWTETVLYSFTGGTDGANPYAGVIFDQSGNLYGATSAGGSGNGGTVFELTASKGSWTFNLLYSFSGASGQFSAGPLANHAFDSAGNLYGTAHGAGAYNFGSAFKLTSGAGGWTYTSL